MPRSLSVHGVPVPTLGLGTWKLKGDDATAAVRHALDIGYRHIDTAQIYGNEAEVGRGIAAADVPRDEVFLTTKVWHESLRRLGTDYVDLLLMHWPTDDVPLAETLGALAEVRDAGKTRLIGVSNTPPGMMRRALEIEPTLANNQVEYHPYLGQEPLLEIARESGTFLTAYRPIANGNVMDDATIQEIAEAHDATPVQIAIAWLLGQDRVSAIPKSGTRSHIAANFQALEITLSDDERAAIDALERGQRMVDPDFAPDWNA
ncbi:MAG TPA: aldo/keto reductase [Rhodothermales bacterium]|nr:aldo/keto reductase [Rhodothermales bacterium]